MSRRITLSTRTCTLLLCFAATSQPAIAQNTQSGFAVYGLVDASVKYVDDFGGKRRIAQDSGDQQGPRLGFRGAEDLGEGLRAVFVLESGVSFDTGAFAQGGLAFGRQAYVGLVSAWGALTLGRQYDFMVELGAFHGVQQGTGTLDWNVGDNDRVSGQRLDNSVKYVVQRGGFSAGVLYSAGESAPLAKKPSGASYLARYSRDGWSVAAAATSVHDAPVAPFASLGLPSFLGVPVASPAGAASVVTVDRVQSAGVGAGHTEGPWSLLGLYTRTRYEDEGRSQSMQNRNLAVRYAPAGRLVFAASAADSRLGAASWKRIALAADYVVSPRTDLYVYAVGERAGGAGVHAVLFTALAASGDAQRALVAGIRHKF
jgi:outer membrane protein OmpU